MATIKDIANIAKVSVATVSYVLNNSRYVSAERKQRVLEAVSELGYVPNAIARGLRVQATRTIGLVMSDITNPFYPELARGCQDVARSSGFSVLMLNTDEREDRFHTALKLAKEGKVDGLIVANILNNDLPVLKDLIKSGCMIVLAHRKIPGFVMDSVVADNYGGASAVVRHLTELGHRRIAFISGIPESSVSNERIAGYKDSIVRLGIEKTADSILPGFGQYEPSYALASLLMQRGPAERPTAIIADSDVAALAVIDLAYEKSLRIPQDIAIVGFDDLFFASSRAIELTTVRIPRYEIGQQAARILLQRIQGKGEKVPEELVLPTQLIVRKTST